MKYYVMQIPSEKLEDMYPASPFNYGMGRTGIATVRRWVEEQTTGGRLPGRQLTYTFKMRAHTHQALQVVHKRKS